MAKSSLFKHGSYAAVLCGFILMFFLTLPSFDVFFFSRDYETSLQSFWENSLFYGNGRLLGNILGISFSHYFEFAFLIIAVSLTLIVLLINTLVFDNNYRTIFPIAFVIAFPCKGIFGEVYSVYASFTNYVLPTILLLATWCLLKKEKKSLTFIPVLLFSALACLFSENSTIVVLVSSVLFIAHSIITTKKVSFAGICFFVGSVIGSLGMFLIPKLTQTTEKLAFYREIKTEIISLIKSAIAVSFSFSNMFSTFIVPIVLCSISLTFLILKHSKVKKSCKMAIICYLLFFAAESFVSALFSDDSLLSIYFASMQTVMVVVYAAVVFVSLLCLEKSDFKLILIELYILVLFSIGPLLIVSKYGYRTFYLTFILLFVFACFSFKRISKYIPALFDKKIGAMCKRIAPAVFATAFIFLSANVFMQSTYNYNFYIVRTQYIAQQVNHGEKVVAIPTLPCKSIVCEDEHPSSLGDILHETGAKARVTEQALVYCENVEEYDSVLSKNPVSSASYSFNNLQYKSPFIVFSLIEKQ